MSGRRKSDLLTDGARARIVAAYRDGVVVDGIAQRFGVTKRVAYDVLRAAGVPLRGRGHAGGAP